MNYLDSEAAHLRRKKGNGIIVINNQQRFICPALNKARPQIEQIVKNNVGW